MRKIGTVVWKESRQILRDRLSLAMLLGVPAMILVLYGYALSFDVDNIRLAVEDRDQSRHSRELIATFVNSGYFELVEVRAEELQTEELTERRQATAVVVIPEGFARDLESSHPSEVQLLLDGTNANTATTALNYARTIVAEVNRSILLEAMRRAGGQVRSPIDVRGRFWYNPELKSSHYLVPGLMGFILMVTSVIATALSVVREKERGTLEQLRLTPLGTGELVVGKTIPYLGLSLVAALIIILLARLLFGVVVQGSGWELLAVTTLYLVGALGWGRERLNWRLSLERDLVRPSPRGRPRKCRSSPTARTPTPP